ncbi:large-conductance mechanosensitive channel [Variovorax boronicumulans]|uniref:hypothetical protein n=1 Tax=Variovorax boronicumulans TaxID=436515 RepID=UPI00278998E3|nr:hypothetical protein [Variovorax boronicumulans]MDP9912764.1 large-conductance mechanosensitive channel [Variovorax boronicumulans]
MKNNAQAILVAIVLTVIAVYLSYFFKFHSELSVQTSADPAVWGQFGDYIGGVLNPLLSFASIFLLIKSLLLQFEANERLRNEIKDDKQAERLKSFELLFFNLIDSQKKLLDGLLLNVRRGVFWKRCLRGSQAVLHIERQVNDMRVADCTNKKIGEFLDSIDEEDQIFGVIRAFYILVKIVSDRLSDSNGFSSEDRKTHLAVLVNFTDFSQLRLILIYMQYADYASVRYLRSSNEFKILLEELGMSIDSYA